MMGKGEREKGERKIEIEKRGDRKRDRDTGRERHRKMTEGHKERGKDRQRDRETDTEIMREEGEDNPTFLALSPTNWYLPSASMGIKF